MKNIIALLFVALSCSALESPKVSGEQKNAPMATAPSGIAAYRLYECSAPNIIINQFDISATIMTSELGQILNASTRYFRITTIYTDGSERIWLNRMR